MVCSWAAGTSSADTNKAQPIGNSDSFFQKYPHLEDFFPYFAYMSYPDCRTLDGERMVEKWNECYFNIIISYDFFQMIADMGWGKDWYVVKSLGITPKGQALFNSLREHRLKLFGHVQMWMGQYSKLNPIHELFKGKDRELTEQEFADAEAKLKKELEWFAALSQGQLKDLLMYWVTDDEPDHVGPTKAMHRMLAKYDPSKPVFNVDPWMGNAEKLVPHVEIQGCDFYVHADCYQHQWDMQDKFEKLYRLNPKAITMFVGDLTTYGIHEQTKSFLRDSRPSQAELRSLVWQSVAGGAKGVGYWNFSRITSPLDYAVSVMDYYYLPQKMNVQSVVAELGQRLTAIGPLLLRTHPELDGRPVIGCATCDYSTYTGSMIRCGALKHNTKEERYIVLHNYNMDGAASGTVTARESWSGKHVYDLDRLVEVNADAKAPGIYPVSIGAAGDAVVWLVGSPEDFERCKRTILRHRAEMALPLVENQMRLATRWNVPIESVEALLAKADAQAKAGEYGACWESRKTALKMAQGLTRGDKDIAWLQDTLSSLAKQLSGISAKVAGNWRALEMGETSNADAKVSNDPVRNPVAGGALCMLHELGKAYFEAELMFREGQRDKLAELRRRLPMLEASTTFLDQQFDRIIAAQLAIIRKPVRMAYLTTGRDRMDFALTNSWLDDACLADWVTLGDDGVLRNSKKEAVKLNDYDVLWMHQLNSWHPTKNVKNVKPGDVLSPAFIKPEFVDAVKAHLAAGKGLLLTGLSSCYATMLGREAKMPDAYHDGGYYPGNFDVGYKPVPGAEGHPVFKDLDAKGFYTNNNMSPYNEVSECTWFKAHPSGRVIASLLDSEIGEVRDYATLLEYPGDPSGSKGLIIAMGGTAFDATPGLHSSMKKDNSMALLKKNQRALLLNVLEYLAQGKPYALTSPASAEPKRYLSVLPPVWRFKLDPKDEGLSAKWQDPALDESSWKDISIGTSWNSCGYDYKDGHAWYRVRFSVPPELIGKTVSLRFGAVDEAATVFLDGKELGQHEGWNTPFQFDVTDQLGGGVGAEHQLTVRVFKGPVGAGGIWRKVWLEAVEK